MNILGYHIAPGIIARSDGQVCTEPPWVEYLLTQPADAMKVLYYLDYNVAALLKMIDLTEEELKKLWNTEKLRIQPYKLTYFQATLFVVDTTDERHLTVSFTDAMQYMDAHKLTTEPQDAEYCIERAREAQEVGTMVFKTLAGIGMRVHSLSSPVANLRRNQLKDIKWPHDEQVLPAEVSEYCEACCKGSWVETFQRGHFQEAYHYDLRNAYGSVLATLPHTMYGNWDESARYEPEASYGYIEARVRMDAPLHPVFYRKDEYKRVDEEGRLELEGMHLTPNSEWVDVFTKEELDFIKEFNLGEYEILNGCWWFPEGHQVKFLKGLVEWLYRKREPTLGAQRRVLGRLSQGIYGLTLERRTEGDVDVVGDFYNPMIGAECQTQTRLAVARFCLERGVMPIAVVVDSVILPQAVPINDTGAMGDWRLVHSGKCIALSSSPQIAMEGKGEEKGFSLKYDWLRSAIEREPTANVYLMDGISPVTLGKALGGNRLVDVGAVEVMSKAVRIDHWDGKRYWPEYAMTGGQLLTGTQDSEPLTVDMIELAEPLTERVG